ncbi:MAG: hypothetical protein IPN13_14625 [Bacteroidetes bacterium]|nr:hypothetical protein [Bacteroidota bacterium]
MKASVTLRSLYLDRCLEVMPDKTVPFNLMMLRIADLYFAAATLTVCRKLIQQE